MKKIKMPVIRFAIVIIMVSGLSLRGESQSNIPDELLKSTLKGQMDYIQGKTRIYEDYRAIREDMFQLIKRNSLDSLKMAMNQISSLKGVAASRNFTIDSLNSSLISTGKKLEEMSNTKNSISIFGIEIRKNTYNAIMWLTIAILAGSLVAGFLSYKRDRIVTMHTKRGYEDLKKEYDAYKKASREAREKMSMTHFNEMKKLRTG
jgi:hypothetical protein